MVRLAVRDPGPGFAPTGRTATDPAHVGGWGLVLVDQLAQALGPSSTTARPTSSGAS